MNAIFRDSLARFSNVCNGCFKTIYTLGMLRARDLGIPIVVTGLSRGQMFETRLSEEMFRDGRFRPDEVDAAVLAARKVYHRVPDEVSRTLDVRAFQDDRIFEQVQFVDFYRYCDVGMDEMLDYLATDGAVDPPVRHRPLDQLPDQRPRHLRAPEGARLPQLRAALQLGRAPRPQDARRRARGAGRRHRSGQRAPVAGRGRLRRAADRGGRRADLARGLLRRLRGRRRAGPAADAWPSACPHSGSRCGCGGSTRFRSPPTARSTSRRCRDVLSERAAQAAYRPPEGPVEEFLAGVWRKSWAWSASDPATASSISAAPRSPPCR